ncbi:MAG: peroxiredoxin [Pseudomonadota bacterium]
MELKPGDAAPDFDLPTDTGRAALSDFRGRKLVLFFYPKDDTPGCTTENVAFSAASAAFEAAGAALVGISKDSVKRHAGFRRKHGLTVELASDAEGDVTERYGAWVEKSLYGRTYMGIDRSTWLIDGEGVIRRIWRKVRVAGHVDQVLEAVRAL